MSSKTHARDGRGAGNGYNQNWHNSPLWKNIEKNKKDVDTKKEIVNNPILKETHEMTDEEILRERRKKMFAFVH